MTKERTSRNGFIFDQKLTELLPNIVIPFEDRLISGIHYQVRIGDTAWVSTILQTERKRTLTVRSPLIIPAGREAVVRSWELFNMPRDILGFIEPENLYAIKGLLLLSPTFLEPGTNSHMFFTLSNLADQDIEIHKGDGIGRLFLYQLDGEVNVDLRSVTTEEPAELPRVLERELETYPVLSTKVRILEQNMDIALRNDHLLLDFELGKMGFNLINPFLPDFLRPDGYQLRIGDRADIFFPKEESRWAAEGRIAKYISAEQPLKIPPGNTVVVRTQEKLAIPDNICVSLSALGSLSKRYINFDGKVLSPGYKGYVWCNLYNYGTVDAELQFNEPFIFAQFLQLGHDAQRPIGKGRELDEYFVEDLPSDEIPESPTSEWDNLVSLTRRVEQIETQVQGFGPTKTIIDLIFLALVAGIIAGIALLVLPSALQAIPATWPLNPIVILVVVVVVIVGSLFLYYNYRVRRR